MGWVVPAAMQMQLLPMMLLLRLPLMMLLLPLLLALWLLSLLLLQSNPKAVSSWARAVPGDCYCCCYF